MHTPELADRYDKYPVFFVLSAMVYMLTVIPLTTLGSCVALFRHSQHWARWLLVAAAITACVVLAFILGIWNNHRRRKAAFRSVTLVGHRYHGGEPTLISTEDEVGRFREALMHMRFQGVYPLGADVANHSLRLVYPGGETWIMLETSREPRRYRYDYYVESAIYRSPQMDALMAEYVREGRAKR